MLKQWFNNDFSSPQNLSPIGGEEIKGKYTYGESVPEQAKI
jgi:hypothetical protein